LFFFENSFDTGIVNTEKAQNKLIACKTGNKVLLLHFWGGKFRPTLHFSGDDLV